MISPQHPQPLTCLALYVIFMLHLYIPNTIAQPAFQTFATSETGSSGSTTLDAKPSGLAEGDLLLAFACYESGNSQTVTSPAGWDLIEKTDEGSNIGLTSFYKIADANDVNSSTFSFILSEDKKWSLAVVRISDADGMNPINTHSSRTGAGGNTKTWSVNTTEDSCLVLAIYGNKKDATYKGAFNEEYEIEHEEGQIASQMLESFIQESAGATGNTQAKPSNKDSYVAQQIAIRKSSATLLNNFRSLASGNFDENNCWEREQSDGTWLSPSNSPPSM
ncbi:MAG: hypothetical protein AAGA77_25960, partial [Bacteroidota bacterium]